MTVSRIHLEFEEAAAEKWALGVQQHRNGDPSAPFSGNLAAELWDEALDIYNYASELQKLEPFRESTLPALLAVYARKLGEAAQNVAVILEQMPKPVA